MNFSYHISDFSGHEFLTPQRGLVVEQDAAGGKNIVGFPVIDCCPMSKKLGHAVWASRVKRRILRLGDFLDLSEKLGCGSLVELDLRVDDAYCLEQMHRAKSGDVR